MRLTTVVLAGIAFLTATAAYGGCRPEKEILARNAYYEARGEGETGMRLVAEVTVNRVKAEEFPDTICDVVNQPGQFHWVGKGMSPPKGESWETAQKVAEDVLNNGPELTTAIYFKRGNSSRWQNRPRQLRHKNHSFY